MGLCFSKDSHGNPVQQIQCPSDALTESYDNSCVVNGAKEIYILGWGQTPV